MIVCCPSCRTRYRHSDEVVIPPAAARCSRCAEEFPLAAQPRTYVVLAPARSAAFGGERPPLDIGLDHPSLGPAIRDARARAGAPAGPTTLTYRIMAEPAAAAEPDWATPAPGEPDWATPAADEPDRATPAAAEPAEAAPPAPRRPAATATPPATDPWSLAGPTAGSGDDRLRLDELRRVGPEDVRAAAGTGAVDDDETPVAGPAGDAPRGRSLARAVLAIVIWTAVGLALGQGAALHQGASQPFVWLGAGAAAGLVGGWSWIRWVTPRR